MSSASYIELIIAFHIEESQHASVSTSRCLWILSTVGFLDQWFLTRGKFHRPKK